MKRKILSLISTICLIISCQFMLVACGGNPDDGGYTSPDEYRITFVVDDNYNYHTIVFDGESSIALPIEPSKEYFRFDGWFLDYDVWENQLTIDYFLDNPITENIYVYAKFTDIAEYYTVDFDTNGGSAVDSLYNVRENLTISIPNEPIKENCEFLGWFSDSSFENEWNFSTDIVTSNTTLYAKWLQNYLVTYVLNYSGATDVQRMTVGGLIDYAPTREGYIFNGWYISEGIIDGNYILTEKFNAEQVVDSEGLILYAEWVKESTISTQLPAPVVRINKTSEMLEWDDIDGATGYNIVVYYNGSEFDNHTTTNSYYIMNDYISGNYTVKIRALGDGVNSINSEYVTKYYSLRVLTSPTNITIDITTSIVTWDAVKYATDYKVYINGNYVRTVTDCQFDMTDYDAGSYSVKIEAERSGYISAHKTATCIKRKLIAPVVQYTFDSTTKAYKFAWNSITNANTYYIYINGVYQDSTSSNSYNITRNSNLWNDLEELEFYVTAFDKNTNYLMSTPSNKVEVVRVHLITANLNISDAGSVQISSNSTDFGGIAGESYTLTAMINNGYNFEGWYDGQTLLSTDLTYTFTMPTSDVTFDVVYSNYTVTTTINNSNAGTITNYTNRNMSDGETIIVTAIVNDGYNFEGWFDADEYAEDSTTAVAKSTELTYEFTMGKQDINLIAVFSNYTVNTAINNSNAGTITKYTNENISDGETVTVTATVNDGYNFEGWFDADEYAEDSTTAVAKSTELTYEFTMGKQDVNLIAVFSSYTVKTSVNIAEAGSTNYETATNISNNREVKIIATVNEGYNFVGWYSKEDQLITNEVEYTFTMEKKNVEYIAKYNYFTVTTLVNIDNAGSTNYATATKISKDREVTIIATTNNGYNFIGWYTQEDDLLTASNEYTFTMGEQNEVFVAKYTYYTLTTSMFIVGRTDEPLSDAGSITEYSNQEISIDESISLTAVVNKGYNFVGWFDSSEYTENTTTAQAVSTDLTYEFTMTNKNVNLIAVYDFYTLTVTMTDEKVGKLSGAQLSTTKISTGTMIYLSVFVQDGYIVKGWYDADEYASAPSTAVALSINSSYKFTMGRENVNLIFVNEYEDLTLNVIVNGEPYTTIDYTLEKGFDPYKIDITLADGETFSNAWYTDKNLVYTYSEYTQLEIVDGNTYLYKGTYNNVNGVANCYFTYDTGTDSYSVSYLPNSKNVVAHLPDTYNKKAVTGIEEIFSGEDIIELIIPDGYVLKAKDLADLVNLQKLTLPCTGTTYRGYIYPLGYWFGTSAKTGLVSVNQEYYEKGVTSGVGMIGTYTTYYIPESLTEIVITGGSITGVFFENMLNLTKVDISKTDGVIGLYAFRNCKGLTSVELPDSLTKIGFGIFAGCTSLTNIDDILETTTSISNYMFDGCTGLTSVKIPDCITAINSSAFGDCTGLTSIEIPNTVTYMAREIFYNCTSLTSIEIPSSINSLGDSLFYGCTNLASIEIPNSIRSLGNGVFWGCTSLTSIIIPDSVSSMGSSVFGGCTSLTNVVLSESITAIGNSTFSGCTNLTSIILPETITSIGEYAFKNCSNITSLVIGSKVTSIGVSAFDGCSNLQKVYYMGTNDDWSNITLGAYNQSMSERATRYYYSETTSYRGWHYVDGVPTAW